MRIGSETYHHLMKLLKSKYGKISANVGDEDGFGAPQIKDENETLELIIEAIQTNQDPMTDKNQGQEKW